MRIPNIHIIHCFFVTNFSVTSDKKLNKVEFGPTYIQLIDDDILQKYTRLRYGRESFCDFPFNKEKNVKIKYSLPARASQIDFALSHWYIPVHRRDEFVQQIGKKKGKDVTVEEISNLDQVEVDNSIAAPAACNVSSGKPLNIVNFNAERGRYWVEFADLLLSRGILPDIIILNEMDIGMARSSNIHTTRKLAFRLKMNYAWGLEFVELTRGNHEEQNRTAGSENALGLHGNAILSRCKLFDAAVFRDPLADSYFSNQPNKKNAMGSEKRLGGRMSLFVRSGFDTDAKSDHIVVGSVHKAHPFNNREKIWEYLGFGQAPSDHKNVTPGVPPVQQKGIIVGGDLESRSFCTLSGFKNLDRPMKPTTFPADCTRNHTGNFRGDYICGNVEIDKPDTVILPCSGADGMLQLSDHSIIQITLRPRD